MTKQEKLEEKGIQIEQILNRTKIACGLKSFKENETSQYFEFNLVDYNAYHKLDKAVKVLEVIIHEPTTWTKSEKYHFGIMVEKKNVELAFEKSYKKYHSENRLSALLGLGDDGKPMYLNLQESIHTLVGGATGMGKTTLINNILYSLTQQNTPDQLQLCLIDTKKNLDLWKHSEHLMCQPISKTMDAYETLFQLDSEMRNRIRKLEKLGLANATPDTFPYIVVVVDELADLMLSNFDYYIQKYLVSLAQLGRSVNISLILATQNPLVKVCTSLIKANCPTRIAFKTASATDSRNILGNKHAFEIGGIGECIVRMANSQEEQHVKVCKITEKDIKGEE